MQKLQEVNSQEWLSSSAVECLQISTKAYAVPLSNLKKPKKQKNTLVLDRKKWYLPGWGILFHYSSTFSFFYGCSLPACSYNGWGENSVSNLLARGLLFNSFLSFRTELHATTRGRNSTRADSKQIRRKLCEPSNLRAQVLFFCISWSHSIYSIFWIHKLNNIIIYPVLWTLSYYHLEQVWPKDTNLYKFQSIGERYQITCINSITTNITTVATDVNNYSLKTFTYVLI